MWISLLFCFFLLFHTEKRTLFDEKKVSLTFCSSIRFDITYVQKSFGNCRLSYVPNSTVCTKLCSMCQTLQYVPNSTVCAKLYSVCAKLYSVCYTSKTCASIVYKFCTWGYFVNITGLFKFIWPLKIGGWVPQEKNISRFSQNLLKRSV